MKTHEELAKILFRTAIKAAPANRDPALGQVMDWDALPAESRTYWTNIAKAAQKHAE